MKLRVQSSKDSTKDRKKYVIALTKEDVAKLLYVSPDYIRILVSRGKLKRGSNQIENLNSLIYLLTKRDLLSNSNRVQPKQTQSGSEGSKSTDSSTDSDCTDCTESSTEPTFSDQNVY